MRFTSGKNIICIVILYYFLIGITENHAQQKTLKFDHLTVDNGLSQNTIHGILEDKYGFMWFGTWAGLCKYDGYKFIIYRSDPDNPKTIINNRIHYIYKDSSSTLWVASFDSVYICRYNYETNDFTRILRKTVPKRLADSLTRRYNYSRTHALKDNYFWEVNQNDNFLYQTDLKSGKKHTYGVDFFNKWSLNDDYITDLYLSQDNILWVGTYNGGINKANLDAKPFDYYYHSPLNKNSLTSNLVRAICEDLEGNLWIGTRSMGLSRLDRKRNIYTHYSHNDQNTNSLISDEIRHIYCDKLGYLWIGTKKGLSIFDPKTKHFENFSMYAEKNIIPHNWVYWIMEDYKDNVWIGTWNGIAKYNRKKNNFYAYKPKETLMYPYVRVIIEDDKHNLWVATEGGGLTKLTRDFSNEFEEKLTPTHYVNSPSNSNSLINNRIYSLLKDEDGIFWIGTGGGLNRFDPNTNKFTRFNNKNGFPDEMIMGILSDGKQTVWISHKKGLSSINRKTFEMHHYSEKDGLQSDEFSEDAYFKDSKGEMFFGGLNGMNSFFPEKIKPDTRYPKVVFTDFYILNKQVEINQEVNGRIVLKKAIYLTDEITLTHLDKSIRIEFTALSFINPEGNKYKYMLKGFDNDWNYTHGSKRSASYSNLKPKTYILQVVAAGNGGIWNPVPVELKIKVLPPWWGTLLFKLIIILACIIAVITFIYIRTTLYRAREKELTYLVQQRTKELENSNDLLRERQFHIEQQAAELQVQTENLMETNDLLVEKQAYIQIQSQKLEDNNKQLTYLNATKDKLFSIIAHDLRNPFHTVMGFSELLLTSFEKLPIEKVTKYLHLIHTSSLNGNILLENLLQWSRSQTGKINFDPDVLDLQDIAGQVVIFLEIDAQRKNILINNSVEPGIFVYADSNMLLTILRNLLSNAIKFTHQGGRIEILAEIINNAVKITIADNGIGIPKESQFDLFDINKNISRKGTDQEAGTGLGLILCKEFIDRHNGRIWVESEEGKGSKFKFTLPISHHDISR